MQSISGIFENQQQADRAIFELINAGFDESDISLMLGGQRTLALAEETEACRSVMGGATGAFFGGALGALIGGMTAAGSIMLPGGILLISGPIVAALSGAGAGGVIGGLTGALIEAGFADDDAKQYEQDVKSGKAVVIVRTADERHAAAARAAFRHAEEKELA